MPWCDACSRFYNPNSMPADGTCPSCGTALAGPASEVADEYKAPWHFWVMVVAAAVYMVWRFVQMIGWAIS